MSGMRVGLAPDRRWWLVPQDEDPELRAFKRKYAGAQHGFTIAANAADRNAWTAPAFSMPAPQGAGQWGRANAFEGLYQRPVFSTFRNNASRPEDPERPTPPAY